MFNPKCRQANRTANCYTDLPPSSPANLAAIEAAGGDYCPEQTSEDTSISNNKWQSLKTNVVDRLSFLFNNDELSDVHFLVGQDRQRIPAHKLILSIGSAVFNTMFNGTFATQEKNIELPDVEPSAFLALLKFLYTDKVKIDPETVMTILYTAKKYDVPSLVIHCVDFLKSNLRADNALMLLTQARLFDEHQLAVLCLETIDRNTTESLGADVFTEIDLDTLALILIRNSLRIQENKLYSAVLRWCEAECLRQGLESTGSNFRQVLGPNLLLIRFPLMTVEEFAAGPAQTGILTDKEIISVFRHYALNPKPPTIFRDIPRSSLSGKEYVVNRFESVESRWGYSGSSDRIRFVVDHKIYIVGFGLFGSFIGPAEYDVEMELMTASGVERGYNRTKFTSDGSNYPFRIMFNNSIEIQPHASYIASVKLRGPDSHYGTNGLSRVFVEIPGNKPISFMFDYSAGNNNGTTVEDGQIPEILFHI